MFDTRGCLDKSFYQGVKDVKKHMLEKHNVVVVRYKERWWDINAMYSLAGGLNYIHKLDIPRYHEYVDGRLQANEGMAKVFKEHNSSDICINKHMNNCLVGTEYTSSSLPIRGYTTNALHVCSVDAVDGLLLGVEWEVELKRNKYATARKVLEELGSNNVILKSDSSIGNGFEIVTKPMTLQQHEAMLKDITFTSILSKDTFAGMHVHVGRNAFKPLHMRKFIAFFHSRRNYPFLCAIAERETHYAQQVLADIPVYDTRLNTEKSQKYSTVNTKKDDTLEVRIFKEPKTVEAYMKNVEFVQAAYEFTSTSSRYLIGGAEFIAWMKVRKKQFPHLHEFIFSDEKKFKNTSPISKEEVDATRKAEQDFFQKKRIEEMAKKEAARKHRTLLKQVGGLHAAIAEAIRAGDVTLMRTLTSRVGEL